MIPNLGLPPSPSSHQGTSGRQSLAKQEKMRVEAGVCSISFFYSSAAWKMSFLFSLFRRQCSYMTDCWWLCMQNKVKGKTMSYLFPIPGCFSVQTSTFVQGRSVTCCLKTLMFVRPYKPHDHFKYLLFRRFCLILCSPADELILLLKMQFHVWNKS